MINTYKLLSLLLSYPDEDIYKLTFEAESVLKDDQLLSSDAIEGVSEFCKFFSSRNLIEWQEHYVQLFDYSRSVSLHLFEHLHGDSKDRGQAMVDLIHFYESAGFSMVKPELPDYLPVFLEFLSLGTPENGSKMLADVIDILGVIHHKLVAKDNPFRHLLYALINLSAIKPNEQKIAMISSRLTEVNLDEAYQEEEPVTFGCQNSPEYKQETR